MTKVLVIEDEKEICENISKILEKKGVEVTSAYNVTDGEKLIRTKLWDAIICDVMLPHLGGFELADISKEVSGTPVILITGVDKEILSSTKSMADAIIQKPFTPGALIASMEQAGVQL